MKPSGPLTVYRTRQTERDGAVRGTEGIQRAAAMSGLVFICGAMEEMMTRAGHPGIWEVYGLTSFYHTGIHTDVPISSVNYLSLSEL